MKLYLSSYRLGNYGELLAREVSGKKKIGVIFNALDASTDTAKLKESVQREFSDLKALGLDPHQIDLRDYFEENSALGDLLEQFNALWVVGGNSFVLRRAFSKSGLDQILLRKNNGDTEFLYGGYSAGVVVLTPSLKGIHLMDEPECIPPGYSEEIIWTGLSIVPFSIVPHYRSVHHETELADKAISFMIEHKIPFIALRDGEVYFRGFS